MRYLPIHVDLENKHVLIVGGGDAAEAKLRTLLKTVANLHLVAPHISAEIMRWVDAGQIIWSSRAFTEADLNGVTLVYAATEDDDVNARIAAMASKRGLMVNAADQKTVCGFITPAIVDRSPVVLSIGTEGTSPSLARALKSDLEGRLPSTLGTLALVTQELRRKVTGLLPVLSDRQRFWARIFGEKALDAQLRYTPDVLRQTVEQALVHDTDDTAGHVALVGAGPGSSDLLTLAARQKLHSADVVVYDRLVSQEVLDFARREAEYIYVGKEPGSLSTLQETINTLLVEKAKAGLSVVRLKSGDPLIFGRADEEINALQTANIPYTIVPGITAAASAATQIGRSLTSRGINKSISFMTGHDTKGFAEQDWVTLAADGGRAAVYMGVGAARFIQGRLLLHGAMRNKPITIVENASRDNQVIVSTTLDTLPADIDRHDIKGPAVLLIGYAPREEVSIAPPLQGTIS